MGEASPAAVFLKLLSDRGLGRERFKELDAVRTVADLQQDLADLVATEDVFAMGAAAVAGRIRERVGDRPAFISFDSDVVDPAYAPGTGTPAAASSPASQRSLP